jgi:HK97 family phage prohead protease
MIKRNAPELPERQIIAFPFEVAEIRGVTDDDLTTEERSTGAARMVAVSGVASVYNYEYDVYGGPANMGWVERIAKGAFDATLAEDPDVVFLLNHAGLPVARTKSKTLDLRAGKSGLEVRSHLDPRDTDVANLLVKMERGDVDEMSFAFRVTRQEWQAHKKWPQDEMSLRTIAEVNLHRGDVSAVTFGASDATTIDITRSLRLATDVELEEYQALITERLNTRSAALDGMSEQPETTGGMPVHLLHLLRL